MSLGISRRRWLALAAAGAGLSACRSLTVPAHAPVILPIGTNTLQPTVIRAFEDAYPRVHIESVGIKSKAPYVVGYQVGEFAQSTDSPASPAGFADLTPALRKLNFNAGSVFPGTLESWTSQGLVLGVPYSIIPWGVRWRSDLFSAAGLSPPSADWTLAEFEADCTVLQDLATSGRLKGVRTALGPMSPAVVKNPNLTLPMYIPGTIYGKYFQWTTTMAQEGLWEGFVRGFGGTIATDGQFSFAADARSVSAIAALIGFIQNYALPVDDVVALASSARSPQEVPNLFGMAFDTFFLPHDALYPSPPWAWARLPRFPVQPVIPVLSTAIALVGRNTQPPASDTPEVLAAAQLGVWLNSSAATELTGSSGTPPASSNASIQARFWAGRAVVSVAAVGDWQNFSDVYDGFPAIPQQDPVYDAIAGVLDANVPLQDALVQAQQKMNAQLLQSTGQSTSSAGS